MADQQITQTVIGDHNIFTGSGDINVVYQLPPVEAEDRRNLLILLNKVKQFWIEGVLEQSVYSEAMIQLGKESRPEMVHHPWERVLELPNSVSRSLPPDKNIIEIFDDVGRTLLILGEPGSGKTITMLELALELIKIAENDPMQPIPVVFNLSTWTIQNPAIFDWLVGELSSKYQIPKRFGRPWLEKPRLLLLLDGLDEVNPNHRGVCVEAINEFVEKFGVPGIAVCSRIEEYLALPIYLKLSGAICLEPLTQDQISDYVVRAGPKLNALKIMLEKDTALYELAETPLMLSVMSLAYQDLPMEALAKGEPVTIEERRNNLFDTYIKRMFERRGKADPLYESNQVIEWLTWLSSEMTQHSKTIFFMEELQPSWLPTRRQFWVYALISRIIFWLSYGLIAGLIAGLSLGLNSGLSSGLIVGIGVGLLFILTNRIKTRASEVKTSIASGWPWVGNLRRSRWGPKVGLTYGLTYGLSSGLISGLSSGPYAGLMFGLFVGVIAGLTGRRESITTDIQTNEALNWSWEGLRKGGIWGLISGLFVGLFFGLSSGLISGLSFGLSSVLICLIFGCLKSSIIEKKSSPNQGIFWSIRNVLIWGLILSLILGLIFILNFGLRDWFFKGLEFKLMDRLIFGALFGLPVVFIVYGGIDVIKHYTLRLILWWNGHAPLKYARFLDFATKLIFLRKVGGGYIFIHRMLLEHFAAMRKEEVKSEVS